MEPVHPEPKDLVLAETVKQLSDRIVEAQRPLRILDAIKWDDQVEEDFFANKAEALPKVDSDYYASRPLSFDTRAKKREFEKIETDITKQLGRLSPVGDILRRMCREYSDVVDMLANRGKPTFARLSRQLYGSTDEAFHAGEPTLADFGESMTKTLDRIHQQAEIGAPDEQKFSSEEAVEILSGRLAKSFTQCHSCDSIRVILDDGIVADAAAGSDYIKLRKDAKFTDRELRLLEVHEGWVHVGTTLNGASQPWCTFLSKGPPSATVTQEGLAVLMEVLAFVSNPSRLRRLTNRIQAVHLAEGGADFLDVYKFYLGQGLPERQAYQFSMRVFRGSLPDGKPFTKDISYTKGFILIYNFLRFAVKHGRLDTLPILFCGKTVLEDVRVLGHLLDEGLVVPPKFKPPQFADVQALSAWMAYSDFLSGFNSDRLEQDYASLF